MNRLLWEVSTAERLALTDGVGRINFSHFAIFDVVGADAEALLEFCSVAKVGTDTPIGKGVYTHFLDQTGGIHSDLTIIRLTENSFRVICGGDTGHRDYVWMKRMCDKLALSDVAFVDQTEQIATLGLWGPEARAPLQKPMADPESVPHATYPYDTAKEITATGVTVWGFRVSSIGVRGW